jgi:hypothetical protein
MLLLLGPIASPAFADEKLSKQQLDQCWHQSRYIPTLQAPITIAQGGRSSRKSSPIQDPTCRTPCHA